MRCSAQTRSLPQSPLPPVGTGPLTVHSQVPPRTFSLPKMMLPGANDCLMLLVQRITPPPPFGTGSRAPAEASGTMASWVFPPSAQSCSPHFLPLAWYVSQEEYPKWITCQQLAPRITSGTWNVW